MSEQIKVFWEVIAHKINNFNANIILEISTLQLLINKKDSSQEQIMRVLESIDSSVEMVSFCLREMEEIFEKMHKGETVDPEVWEKDFRRRIDQFRENRGA